MKSDSKSFIFKKVRNALLLTTGFFIAPGVSAATATEDYLDLSLEQLLDTKVFSASKKRENLSDSPAAIYVITSEDIKRSGMTTLPDLLRMVPGVNVGKTDSNTWAVSIRGFQNALANKLLVMIDGRTVYNPFFAGTFWEVQDVPLEDIMRIEVIRGPGGALWGANAVNGVINILTKSAKDTQGTLLSGGYGNYERGFATARYGGEINKNMWYRAYAKHFNRDNSHALDGDDNNAHDAWDSYRTGFRVDVGEMDSVVRGIVSGSLYRVNTDEINPDYSFTPPFLTETEEQATSEGAHLLGLWRKTYEDGDILKFQTYLDYSSRDQILFQDDRYMFDFEGQYNFPQQGMHAVVLGINYRLTKDNIGGSNLVGFNPASRTDSLFAAFIQDKITLDPDLHLTLGSKFEHNNYTGFEIQPNAKLMWTPDEQQSIWAGVSRAVRTPSRIERDLNITNVRGLFNGVLAEAELLSNPDFKSEELTAYEIGYRNQITPAFAIDSTLFYNDYINLATNDLGPISVVNNGVDPIHLYLPLRSVNQGAAEVYGFEIASTWTVNPDWKLSAGYSYQEMFTHAPLLAGNRQEGDEDGSPEQQINFRSYWNVNDSWTLDTMAYFVDQIPTNDVDPYMRLDLNLGWQMMDGVRFNLVGQDILDDAHHEFGSETDVNTTQAGGRSVFGKVTLEF